MITPTRPTLAARLWTLGEKAITALEALQPAAQLLARLYVGSVFFRAGLTKLHDWDTTLALFMDEYHVPLLDPTLAAYLGTAAELALPVLLVLGLAGRLAAAGMSVLNVVAVLSLAEIADAALQGHVFWGSLLAALLLWGPGRWSLDRFAVPWLRSRVLAPQPAQQADYTAARPSAKA
jgi:putative oxidoreductase